MHPTILETLAVRWHDETACAAFAHGLARALQRQALEEGAALSRIVELRGGLGAGKTTFVRHLLRALGVGGHVRSPTYALVESYRVRVVPGQGSDAAGPQADGGPPGDPAVRRAAAVELEVMHFDFYRFDDPREWEDCGLRDAFAAPGLKLVEWPEKAADQLPTPDLSVELQVLDDPHHAEARAVRMDAFTPAGQVLLRACGARTP